MESTQHLDQETYRVILFGSNGNELLVAPNGKEFLLPSVQIPRGQRLAEALTAGVGDKWGQEAICLFDPNTGNPGPCANDYHVQVMERCGPAKLHARGEWIRVSSLSERTFADPADAISVQRALAKSNGCEDDGEQGPFANLGWFRELRGWAQETIDSLGLHLTGSVSQLNASPSFSLVRFATDGPAVWFKGVGKPNLREFPITVALGQIIPQYVAPMLGTRPEWNGWLALEAEGTNLGDLQDILAWKAAASALAGLQIESFSQSGSLLASGARDLRTPVLLGFVRPFFDVVYQLMDLQTKVPPPVLSKDELLLLAEQIEDALSWSRDLGIPDCLGHLDLNPWNVIVSEGQCVFLDWAEACVGNPVFSFQYLVEHFRRMVGMKATDEPSLASAYTDEWRPLVSPEILKNAIALAPLLAAFAYAVASDAWTDNTRLQDRQVAGYVRSLARRMYREATRLRDRSALCLS